MKKLLLILLLVFGIAALAWFFFLRNTDAPTLAFDTKPENSDTIILDPQNGSTATEQPLIKDDNTAPAKDTDDANQSGTTAPETPPVKEDEKPSEDTTAEENPDHETQEPEKTENDPTEENPEENTEEIFHHSESEKQKIIGRYIEAEDFYYNMLHQNYDLDGYDVITRKNSDGYETEYHRVLYYDVNSLADLKKYYLEYFTKDFVDRIDFSAYVEADDKLYCAMTGHSAKNSKYTYSVESKDITNAYIVRTDPHGNGSTKIAAVNNGGNWYFSSVAIR